MRPTASAHRAINSLKDIDYPSNAYEVLLIRGNHLAKQRNLGMRYSQGEIVYWLDDDAVAVPQALRLIAAEFASPAVAAVGGPSLTDPTDNWIGNQIGLALETMFGALRMRYRYSLRVKKRGTDFRLIGSNLALRKKYVTSTGGVDETILPNEETELIQRLARQGYTIKYSPDMSVYQPRRQSITALIHQFRHYGRGRVKQIRKNPRPQDLLFLLPVGWLGYLVSLIFFHPPWYGSLISFYGGGMALTSLKAALKHRRPSLILSLPWFFPLIHSSYALGLIEEGIKTCWGQGKIQEEPLFKCTIYRLKGFKTKRLREPGEKLYSTASRPT